MGTTAKREAVVGTRSPAFHAVAFGEEAFPPLQRVFIEQRHLLPIFSQHQTNRRERGPRRYWVRRGGMRSLRCRKRTTERGCRQKQKQPRKLTGFLWRGEEFC